LGEKDGGNAIEKEKVTSHSGKTVRGKGALSHRRNEKKKKKKKKIDTFSKKKDEQPTCLERGGKEGGAKEKKKDNLRYVGRKGSGRGRIFILGDAG